MSQSKSALWLYGNHACKSALNNPLRELLDLSYVNEDSLGKIGFNQQNSKVRPKKVDRQWFEKKFGPEAVHQGIAICTSPLPYYGINDLERVRDNNQLVVVLDQVSDPHNVGAIVRSAAAFGAKALVMTDRHAPEESAVLAKSASGALELVPIIRYPNLANAIKDLKEIGFWVYGFAESGTETLSKTKFSGKIALVMGAEGAGMRDLTKKNCDFLIRLDTAETFSTLNVSNAAAVAMYEVYRSFSQ